MPDGRYPIRTATDVENAIRDFNRGGEKPDVKAHIIARAKAIGAESALPDNWMETADKAAAPSLPPNALKTAPEALAKAAAALTYAALKLERAADENAGLRKALDDFSPALADLGKRIAALKPTRCRPRRRCARSPRLRTAPTTPWSAPMTLSGAWPRCPLRSARWR